MTINVLSNGTYKQANINTASSLPSTTAGRKITPCDVLLTYHLDVVTVRVPAYCRIDS